MFRLVIAALVFCTLSLSAWSQTQDSHNAIIDGMLHPELIPDSEAYFLFFVHVANVVKNPDTTAAHAQALVRSIGLSTDDEQTLVSALKAFKDEYEVQVQAHNQAVQRAVAQGFAPPTFLPERDALVQATRDILKRELTAAGLSTLNLHIQDEKRRMRITDPTARMSH